MSTEEFDAKTDRLRAEFKEAFREVFRKSLLLGEKGVELCGHLGIPEKDQGDYGENLGKQMNLEIMSESEFKDTVPS